MAALITLFVAGLGIFAFLTVTVGLLSMWEGFVLSVIWKWFMVSIFGLPALTLVPAIGVCLVVGFLTHQYSSADSKATNETNGGGTAVLNGVVYPLVILVIGYGVHLFM